MAFYTRSCQFAQAVNQWLFRVQKISDQDKGSITWQFAQGWETCHIVCRLLTKPAVGEACEPSFAGQGQVIVIQCGYPFPSPCEKAAQRKAEQETSVLLGGGSKCRTVGH